MMSFLEEVKRQLDQGNISTAHSLAMKYKITDCLDKLDVGPIADSLDDAISSTTLLEKRLKDYESELINIEDLEAQEQAVQTHYENLSKICDLIEEITESLSISDQVQMMLLEGSFDDENSVEIIEQSLIQFERTLQYNPDPTLNHMKCVRDQKEHAYNIKSKFCERFYQYFTRFVDGFLSEYSESFINNIYSQAITMPGHDVIHNHMMYMSPIVHWIWKNDKSTYQALNNFYIARCKAQYDKELKIFFECAKEKMTTPMKHGRVSELTSESRKRSSMTIGDSSTRASSLSGGGTMDTQDTASSKSEVSYTGWDEFDSNMKEILRAIDITCLSEQRFYSSFFVNSETSQEVTNRRLIDMFSLLESEFIEFASYYNSQNGLYSLYLFVGLSQYVAQNNRSQSFLMQIYREVLVRVKRNFDSFMEHQLNNIRELKAPKQSKCGVLSVVKSFEQFAKQVESLFKSTGERRSDIDRWYIELVTELFRIIDRIEHSRTPTEMIRLENYNYLHDVLRSIKVPCLEAQRKESSLQYKAALKAYVTRYFGRPLEKLNIFFDGVQAKVAQGVKEEEISFQLAFSKQELRKVLQMVTLKEVRKGLEEMYKRIEKHAYEPDSNLTQVIWHAMQEEFLTQYKAIQGMIERCYPSSNLCLTFTIDDLLRVFEDIAQSH